MARDVRRLWERRPDDADFLTLRLGTGRVPMTRRPTLDDGSGSLQEPDPICAAAAGRLVRRWTSADGQPLTVDLRGAASVAVRGPRDAALALVRAMLAQAAAWHAPDDLLIAIAASGPRLDEWEWCKWLPHAQDVDLADETGPGRLLGRTFEEFERAAHQEVSARRGSRSDGRNPHLLVVVDGLTGDPRLGGMLAGAPAGVTAVHVVERPHEEPGEVTGRVILDAGGGVTVATGALSLEGRADRLAAGPAQALARLLAPLRLSAGSAGRALGRTVEVTDLLGLGDVATLDPAVSWRPRTVGDFLNVPFGVGPLGEPVRLDLKESALGGHGPHGLLIGATGSGKSELLRTLLVALAATHPPELLAMVLADFKGGAAFAGLSGLPHVAGIITNLSAEMGLVERMRAALIGEQQRRQEMLAAAGNLANIREYQALRARGRTDLEPLPNLLVVIDEFSELIAQHPDFVDVFVGIGRLGRSLGVHLLFSSQRLEEGRLRGLDSHLSYRLGLRTFSALDSRSVLGVPDAYELPPIPGSGYLKVDTSVWQRFKAALVSGPYRAPHEVAEDRRPKPVPFAAVTTEDAGGAESAVRPEDSTGPSVLDVIVDRLRDGAPRVHQVWVSPLPASIGLGSLLGPVEAHPVRGLVAVDWPGIGRLQVALGLVDRPVEQRTDILVHDFSGAAGQLAVVGGPQSGKSTLLRTLVGSLALSHAPTEVQVYGVDLGGGGLRALAGLPHVGTVADRLEPELARRVIGEVHGQLRRR
ncbi:MAG TPA: type VII secretion protein EccCa, partial [Candidatus Dormibacteraeota bacterium]